MTHPVRFHGLTWSHPRGLAPMKALAKLAGEDGPLAVPGSSVVWDAQDLAGFESHPLDVLAARYDLLVLDHPGLGGAERTRALAPLDDLFDAEELALWKAKTIGGSYDSYWYRGHQWAVPIDAAAQVAAYRPDLLPDGVPRRWDAVLALPPEVVVCVPTAGPHTLLSFLGLAAAVDPTFRPSAARLVPRDVAMAAFELLRRLVERTPARLLDLDPIQVLERMQADDIACCPLVFGYVTYSRPGPDGVAVRFADAPALDDGGTPGSVLGGTGLAVARRAAGQPQLLDHVRQAIHDQAQRVAIPGAGGQPSAVAAWEDPQVNADWLGFYRATRRTQEGAWRRPRFAGWITVQSAGSRLLYGALRSGQAPTDLLDELDACYRQHRPVDALD